MTLLAHHTHASPRAFIPGAALCETPSRVAILDETPSDVGAREALLDDAFGPARFLKTCERLRAGRTPAAELALVAKDEDGALIGTLRLWPIEAGAGRPALLLGPLAVAQNARALGVGGALMREALARAKALGHGAVLLVGDAPYYARFGFSSRLTGALTMPGPVERARFLGLELSEGALAGGSGRVRAPLPPSRAQPLPTERRAA